jgi:hypothetical protein
MQFILQYLKKYWWLLLMLLAAAYFTFIKSNDSSLRSSETLFAVADTGSVTRIDITSNGQGVSLVRTQDGWLVNDNSMAHQQTVRALLTILDRVNAISPVPFSIADSLREEFAANGRLVTIFSGNKRLRQFQIVHTELLELGTIGQLKGARTAHRVEAPQAGLDIIHYFSLDPAHWIDSRLRFTSIASLFAIEVELPANPENSFRIDLQKPDEPRLIALYFSHQSVSYDTSYMMRYLTGMENVIAEARRVDLSAEALGEIHFAEPDFIISLYGVDGKIDKYNFIPIPVDEYMDELGRPVHFDLNRMYLSAQGDKQVYEIKFINFAPILKDISYFRPKFKR